MSLAWDVRSGFITPQIPKGWEIKRIGDMVSLINGYPFPSDSFGPEGDLPLARIRDLGDGPFETYVSGFIPKSSVLRDGDIVIGMDGDFNLTTWHKGPAALNQRLCLMRPWGNIDIRFIAYALPDSLKIINDLTFSTTVKHLSSADILAERIPIPSLDEQRRIADFLDVETAQMAHLTSALTAFSNDVREREAALLSHLLNGDTQEVGGWLPDGWKWVPLQHLTDQARQIMYGIVLPGPNVSDGVPIVKGGDVGANRLTPDTLNRTSREIESGYGRSRLLGGDMVIAIRGSVGEVATVPASLTGANLTQDAARISLGQGVDGRWLELTLKSPAVQSQIQSRVTGATVKGINIRDLKRILIPRPPLSDLSRITTLVDHELSTHEALHAQVQRHVGLVAERRQALITAAVTGQIDVTTARGVDVS